MDAAVFSKNCERLLEGEVAEGFFAAVVGQARAHGLLSDEHFTAGATLIEAWAGHKSFKRKDSPGQHTPPGDPGNPSVDFHGERRSNATRQPATDPEARLARKGAGKSGQGGQAQLRRPRADGEPQRHRDQRLRDPSHRPRGAGGGHGDGGSDPGLASHYAGADKGCDSQELVEALRDHQVTPYLACKATPIIDERTTRHPGYRLSQQKRKRIEEIFGWLKTVAGLRKTRHRGAARVDWMFRFALAAYNLVRMRNLLLRAA